MYHDKSKQVVSIVLVSEFSGIYWRGSVLPPFNFPPAIPRISGRMVRFSKLQRFPDFLETLSGHFRILFQIFGTFGWIFGQCPCLQLVINNQIIGNILTDNWHFHFPSPTHQDPQATTLMKLKQRKNKQRSIVMSEIIYITDILIAWRLFAL